MRTVERHNIDGTFVPACRAEVAGIDIAGETVLYDEESGALHLLNPTAAAVWSRCDGTAAIDTVVDEISRAYSVEPVAIRADVIGLVRNFAEQGLLEAF